MADMEIAAELFYSADWHTERTYERDPVDASWGQPDEGAVLGVADCRITLDNRDGSKNPDDARSSLYGLIGRNTPARVTIDGGTYSIVNGVVASWEPDRDTEWDSADPGPDGRGDSWTKIHVAGPSERVNASKSVKSALRRSLDALTQAGTGPAAYWPMEGYERQPSVLQSAVPGIEHAAHRTSFPDINTTSAFEWPGDASLPGSQNLPVLQSNLLGAAGIRSNARFTPAPAAGAAFWTRTSVPQTDDAHAISTSALVVFGVDGTDFIFQLRLDTYPPGSTLATVPANGEVLARVTYFNLDTGVLVDDVTVGGIEFADGWRHFYATLSTSGSDVAVSLSVDGAVVGTGTLTGASLGTTLGATSFNATAVDGTNIEAGRIAVGHPMFMMDSTADMDDLAEVHYQAGLGYPGESTEDRFLRLLAEAGIEGSVFGADPKLMGAQVPDTLPNLLLEIARTELGLIYDKRGSYAMELRTGRSLYNQSAALALAYDTNVHPPIKPATDNLGIANDVTVTSRTGAVARVEKSTGPLNVSDPVDDPEGITRIEGGSDVNPADDADLPDYAGFLLLGSTWPGARYRQVTVSLLKHPELLAAVMGMRPGDRITIDELDADQVDLLALGGSHRLRKVDHVVTFNCVPAGPYRIGLLDDDDTMRIGSGTSSLAADFDAGSDTSMSVTVTGALWATATSDFHIRVGGVVLNVTAVAGATSPQTFTVDATPVNGIERTILAGNRVDVAYPAFIGA